MQLEGRDTTHNHDESQSLQPAIGIVRHVNQLAKRTSGELLLDPRFGISRELQRPEPTGARRLKIRVLPIVPTLGA
jgi:hypothetical protein